MNDREVLDGRTMSGFPLSIGTGLALETIFKPTMPVIDPDRKVPSGPSINKYTFLMVNVETLLRNLSGSLSKDLVYRLDEECVYQALVEEIEFIIHLFETQATHTSVHFYLKSRTEEYRENMDDLRKSDSEHAMWLAKLLYTLMKMFAKNKYPHVDLIDSKTTYKKQANVLLLSHVPYDLLEKENYISLDLLESHTGVVKTMKSFYTKYFPVPKEDMSFLPMCKTLLLIFGDKTSYQPRSINDRREVLKTLREKNVNPTTSEFSIEQKIKNYLARYKVSEEVS